MCATCGCGKKGPMKKDAKKKAMPFEKKEVGKKKSAHEKGESKKMEKLEHLKAKKKK